MRVVGSAAIGVLLLGTEVLAAQSSSQVPAADSSQLRASARQAQIELERFREDRIPPQLGTGGGGCDELVGRMCLRYERDDEPIQEEPPQLAMARTELLRTLARVHREIPGDGWVLGQLVFYLGEEGNWSRAHALAEQCQLTDPWWCDALRGYVLQKVGRYEDAEAAFVSAFGSMPSELAEWWQMPDHVLDADGREAFEDLDPAERARFVEQLWLLGDPLYMWPGNDRRTEHWARKVVVRIREDAANAFGLEWEEDLEQLTMRYGAEVGWERARTPPNGQLLQDGRHIIGRHHPKSQQYVPPGRFVAEPARIPESEWTIEKWEPKTGYAPIYAPDIEALYSQVARFRRGDSLFLVAAWAPAPEERAPSRASPNRQPRGGRIIDRDPGDEADRRRGRNPFGGAEPPPPEVDPLVGPIESMDGPDPTEGPVRSGVYLVTLDGRPAHEDEGTRLSGVATARLPNGEYVLSLEVLNEDRRYAWRARQGVMQPDVLPDLATASDLLILDADGALPETLSEAIPRTLPGVRLQNGERITLAWEVYGLRPGEQASVSIGVTEGRTGILDRIGQFLRIVEPDAPVVLSFEDAGQETPGTVFRAVELNLPDLEPGSYSLHVEIQLPGRTPILVSRAVTILG